MTTANLAEELRVARARRRVTLRKLAETLGMTPNTINRMEHGRMPSARSYERIKDWIENKIEGDPR